MGNLNIFHGPNAGYVLELYERYREDPQSVDATTRAIFEQWTPDDTQPNIQETLSASANRTSLDMPKIVSAARLIRYIRELGHADAKIDPLGNPPPGDPGLRPDIHNVDEADLAKLPAEIVRGPLVEGSQHAQEAIQKLRQAYSGSIGYETDHIQIFEERSWIRQVIEDRRFFQGFDANRKRELLERLTEVEVFERFLHQTFVGQKRFSIEGCDMLVPILDSVMRNAASVKTHDVVIGMAHRGRLNVLAHILGKPYAAILMEFQAANRGQVAFPEGRGTKGWVGDVKYHLGARRAYREAGIEQMPITLAPNPSHLEFVHPIIEGRARAAQEQRNVSGPPLQDPLASLAVIMHGDAAFPGQGVVAETLNLSNLTGYHTGGTIHIIINNQVGFTTEPNDARSTLYASDLAKGFEIPIVHVNADDVEACIAVARMAHAYREQFGKDFLIDLVGYRRWGHNEGDEPAFTQPLMYQQIANHPTVRAQWAQQLEEQGIIQSEEADSMVQAVWEKLQRAWDEVQHGEEVEAERIPPKKKGAEITVDTAVAADQLITINQALLDRPADFTPHSRLERQLKRRVAALEQEQGIDWAHAEALAFATILADGVPIRLTGQDSERGTFSQRHLVLHDSQTGEPFVPHQALPQAQAAFAVHNSPLSENATLGFEYGYSSHAPGALVLWEAQFGDFINGAQVIVDQFIVSGRAKWGQQPALVLLLPHGYEGQGPEHSSARLERFLQLAAQQNMRIVNCTTAAQYFHVLRRQAALLTRDPRPLIVMTPKSLLRHPRAASSLADLTDTQFQSVIDDPDAQERAGTITRLVLCTGKVYVDLMSQRDLAKTEHIAVARIEQLYPFPAQELQSLFARYPALREVVWLQEEPRNMGAWTYIAPRLRGLIHPLPLGYAGRAKYASPAEGSLAEHTFEQARIIEIALNGDAEWGIAAVSGHATMKLGSA
ncbi:MAG: 2-oxoglutarate dehydrogenase E1 component [Chloroflexota bacterium]